MNGIMDDQRSSVQSAVHKSYEMSHLGLVCFLVAFFAVDLAAGFLVDAGLFMALP